MNKAFKFRINPDASQRVLLAKTFGCVRLIYNKMLEDKISHYEKTKENLKATPAGYKDEFPWLSEVDSLSLANAQLHLETAYKNFFRDKSIGFPRFKSKHSGHLCYTTNLVNGNIALENGRLKLPKLGKVKICQHRAIPDGYRLKSVTVSQTPSGKYFASILYEYEAKIEPVEPVKSVGLDFSMSGLYIDSDGKRPEFPHPYRQAQAKLAREQRKLSRRKKGGKNYLKQKLRVAKLHEHIANQRKDFLHKASRKIANSCDACCIEDLNMKAMSKALHFGKSVSDNGWGTFTRILEYKLTDQGKYLVKVDRWFPSSKTCSSCGAVKKELPLALRTFVCDCGLVMDRDVNAALNIRNEGMRLLLGERYSKDAGSVNMNRGTHGDSLVNIMPSGVISQEAPTSNTVRC